LKAGGKSTELVTVEAVSTQIATATEQLKAEVIRLKMFRSVLRPIHMIRRDLKGSCEERLRAAVVDIQTRLGSLAGTEKTIAEEVDAIWKDHALEVVPGAKLLTSVAEAFGCSFSKERADGEKLARDMERDHIAPELTSFLEEVSSDDEEPPTRARSSWR
jgi:hypothetical protein